jgi:hypothetical protein
VRERRSEKHRPPWTPAATRGRRCRSADHEERSSAEPLAEHASVAETSDHEEALRIDRVQIQTLSGRTAARAR